MMRGSIRNMMEVDSHLIDIVGAGAMGMLFAARFLAAGIPVRVWTRSSEQAEELRENGISIELMDGRTRIYKDIYAYPLKHAARRLYDERQKVGKLALFVKQSHWSKELLEQLEQMPAEPNLSVICFQNGIGHIERLSAVFSIDQLLTAVTTEAAKRVNNHQITHTGVGTTWIGRKEETAAYRVETSNDWSNLLNTAGIQAFVSKNIEEMIYQKLLINAVINPLTALLRIRNGELLEQESRMLLMRTVFEEVQQIYDKLGYPLGEQHWNRIIEVCEQTAGNTSSMLADVLEHRPTEIDAITGELLRMADRWNIPLPLQHSLYRLIQALGSD